MKLILQQQIPRPDTRRFLSITVLIGSAIFFILAVFQPFGTYTFQHPDKLLFLAGYGFVIIFTVVTLVFLLYQLFRSWFAPEHWNLHKELLLIGVISFASMSATYFYHFSIFGGRLSWLEYVYFMGIALSTSLFPLLMVVAVRYLQVKHYLERQDLANTLAPKPDVIVLFGENKTEKLTILRSELLLLKAADNYVEVFLQKGKTIERRMLRSTLSKLATQLEDDNFMQVHRSFIVNMSKVVAMEGKSPNYVLRLIDSVEEIPVSRNKIQLVREYLTARPL